MFLLTAVLADLDDLDNLVDEERSAVEWSWLDRVCSKGSVWIWSCGLMGRVREVGGVLEVFVAFESWFGANLN